MICHTYKCIFIHQRKAAGTSIIRSFGYTPEDENWHLFNDGTKSREWKKLRPQYADYVVFTVVRNPWDRFISGWKYLKKYKKLPLDKVMRRLPLWGKDYRHITRPQLDILVDKKGNFVCDYVLRFENLEEDYRNFCQVIGKPFNLRKSNSTKNNGLLEYTSQKQVDFIRKKFKKDIEYFGYDFALDVNKS